MPCLNRDILFAIGKKLVENGIQENVYKFALSGKQQLQAMKDVFASVKILGLKINHFAIGWDNLCCKFELKNNKRLSEIFMLCIGNSVLELQIKCIFSDCNQEFYQPIFDKMIAKKQLTSFSISSDIHCPTSFLNEFLPQFSSTLKHVSIPDVFMTSAFRDSFILDFLTLSDYNNRCLHLFCCKTKSLIFANENPFPLAHFGKFVTENGKISLGLFSIKELHFEHDIYLSDLVFDDLMKYFPSLELIKFNVSSLLKIHFYIKIIRKVLKVPAKIVLIFFKYNKNIVDESKQVCADFEFDESNINFYCFRKVVQSAAAQSTIFEVQIPK